MEESVTGNLDEWKESCRRASHDEGFSRFRSEPAFLTVVEGTPEIGGIWNLRRLLKDDRFRRAVPLIESSDYVGTPRDTIPFIIDGTSYSLNATTIRYANNAANCFRFFGNFTDCAVYEIGAGYGGECKVFNDYAMSLHSRTLNWGVFDLPSSIGIIERFLAEFGYSADILSIKDFHAESNSLVISNGALSEMHGNLLGEYMERVVRPAKYGYFMTNFETHSKPYGGWSTTQFLDALRCFGKDAREMNSESFLSYFDKEAGTRLVVFGTDVPNRADHGLIDVALIKSIRVADRIRRKLVGMLLS